MTCPNVALGLCATERHALCSECLDAQEDEMARAGQVVVP